MNVRREANRAGTPNRGDDLAADRRREGGELPIDRTDHTDRSYRSDRTDRVVRSNQSDRVVRSDRTDAIDRGRGVDAGDRAANDPAADDPVANPPAEGDADRVDRDHEYTDDEPCSATRRREWRRLIVETFVHADYGVVPVDRLVSHVVEREPDQIEPATVRATLTETILPNLDDAGVLGYDAEGDVVINYGS